MYGLNPDMFLAALRHILTFAGGFAVAKGIFSVTPEVMDQVIGAITTLVGVAMAGFFHAASNGKIPTISTTPSVLGDIETRTIISPGKPDAKPAIETEAVTTVSPVTKTN
jgi:hypothetical protein